MFIANFVYATFDLNRASEKKLLALYHLHHVGHLYRCPAVMDSSSSNLMANFPKLASTFPEVVSMDSLELRGRT